MESPAEPDPQHNNPIAWASTLQFPFDDLSPERFERLCYGLVRKDPTFAHVTYMGSKGSDSARDITARRYIGLAVFETWVFQCKRRKDLSPGVFRKDILRLRLKSIDCDVLVFMTSRDVAARTIDKVRQFASDNGIEQVLFWGGTDLSQRVFENTDILIEHFEPAFAFLKKLIRTETKTQEICEGSAEAIEEVLEKLRHLEDVIEDHKERHIVRDIYIWFLAWMFTVNLAHDSIVKFRKAAWKIQRNKATLKKINENTEKRIRKYKDKMHLFEEFEVLSLSTIKKDFVDLFAEEGLGLAWLLHSALDSIETLDAEELDLELLSNLSMPASFDKNKEIMKKAGEHFWGDFWLIFQVNIIEKSEKRDSLLHRVFFRGRRDKCPSCKTQMQYDLSRPTIYITRHGEYIGVRMMFLACYECKKIKLLGLKIERDMEI